MKNALNTLWVNLSFLVFLAAEAAVVYLLHRLLVAH